MNTAEKQAFARHWEKVRRRGPVLYVLFTGLSWGTVSAFAVRFFMQFFDEGFNWPALRSDFLSTEFRVFWGVFILGGLCYGLTMWFYYGWLYRKYGAAEKDQ